MSIVGNEGCPKCIENGRDARQNHAMIFEDGGRYCGKTHLHVDGKPYHSKGDGAIIDKLLESDVTGSIKYTPDQFKKLANAGKFSTPEMRAVALSGMTRKARLEVANEEEMEAIEFELKCEEDYFSGLKIKNLVTRGIRGPIAKLYDVRVGLDIEGKVGRHYYPVHNLDLSWRGAKCRTLPKDFAFDHLGLTHGKCAMFGQKLSQEILKQGGRKRKLLIVGGECDAMAAQQMLMDAAQGQYKGTSYHVWSPIHGEKAMEDIVNNRDAIDQFDEIIAGFDDDPVGRESNRQLSLLFRGKVKFLRYPDGAKDANQCLLEGLENEFVDAWFNPVAAQAVGIVQSVSEMAEEAKKKVEMGQNWPWKKMNKITLGIRDNMLIVLGAGSGVGKTHVTKEVCFHLIEAYNEAVGVIYLEEPPHKTLRSYAGRIINKRIDLPQNDPEAPEDWDEMRDYTDEDAEAAIDTLAGLGKLYIANTGGDKSIEMVMKCIDEFVAMGVKKIVVDNLTAITHPNAGSGVQALDESMKMLGTYKDENPVSIFLISHLKRVGDGNSQRIPHTHGGEVFESDFRGSNAIVFWANYVFGIERNTMAQNPIEKRTTRLRCVKDRDQGIHTGTVVNLYGADNGRLVGEESELYKTFGFNMGAKKKEDNKDEPTEY